MPIECSTYAHSVDAGRERGHAMILLVSVRCERLYTRVSQGVSIYKCKYPLYWRSLECVSGGGLIISIENFGTK